MFYNNGGFMIDNIKKYCDIVRYSSYENELAIKWLYENELYKKVVGTLREELELYVRTFYLLSQTQIEREKILNNFFRGFKWGITERVMVNFAKNNSGQGWEEITYKIGCYFIHLTIFHNWSNEDITKFVTNYEKNILINYINQYYNANLNINSTFDDIIKYSLDIFKKIKDNMEYQLEQLELNENR